MKTTRTVLTLWCCLAAFALGTVCGWGTEATPPASGPELALLSTNLFTAGTAPSSGSLSNTVATNRMDALDDKHLLTVGDKLSFRIEEDQDEPKPLVVTDSGDLEMPYIGRFPAENKTCRQLARELKAELERDYYYQATVIIAVDTLAKSRGRVYLVGPIRTPGPLELPTDEVLTVSKAILRAGGFGDFADKHKVKITRQAVLPNGKPQTLTVDVGLILDKGRTEKDLPLEPGDLVVIPERAFRF